VRALLKAHVLERGVQLRIPGAWSLQQTIESLTEQVDFPFFSGDGKSRQLLHAHLLEVAVEEGRFDIHVVAR
jgi:hypothetical protein